MTRQSARFDDSARLREIEWRKIDRIPDYEFSEEGDVRRRTKGGGSRADIGRVIRPSAASSGYLIIGLSVGDGRRKMFNLHRLVCEAFHGPAPTRSHHAAHFDGDKQNNHKNNLRWATVGENRADMIRHKRTTRGASCASAKLTWAEARQIRKEYRGERGQISALAKKYGVTGNTVSRIIRGTSWQEFPE